MTALGAREWISEVILTFNSQKTTCFPLGSGINFISFFLRPKSINECTLRFVTKPIFKTRPCSWHVASGFIESDRLVNEIG